MSSNPMTDELRSRNLRTVFALAALFFLPLAVAFLLYYGGVWRPGSTASHGELIMPARPLESVSLPQPDGTPLGEDLLEDTWSLVYVGAGACDADCRHALWVMRQTRLLLNKDMARVQRVFFATGECCDTDFLSREHAGLVVADASGAAGAALLGQFPPEEQRHAIYIVDPLGNLMMRFDSRQDPKGLLSDLKKLLKLSHIG